MTPANPGGGVAPGGTQWVLRHGDQEAVICEVGATLRSFTAGGRPLIDGFERDQFATGDRGQVLFPWPNRLEAGRFSFGGRSGAAALDDLPHGCAIHGLVRWRPFRLQGLAQNKVSLGCTLYATPAYPFSVELSVDYHLGREGLSVTTEVANIGDVACPIGLGFHPYLTVGADRLDDVELECLAAAALELNAQKIPTGQAVPVAGTDLDFRTPRRIGATVLDTCLTGLARDGQGRAWITVVDRWRGRQVRLWLDERFHYVQLFSGDTLADPAARRRSLAVEPMTCPPDALNSRRDLVVLEPHQSWQAAWGIGG